MRNRILLAVTGAVLLLVGVAGGIALGSHFTAQAAAQRPSTVRSDSSQLSKYCAIYEGELISQLNTSQSALEQANIAAMTKVLDQMVTDKQITKTERDQIVPLLKQLGVSPCTQLDGKSIMTYLQGNPLVVQQALSAHAALTTAVAGALNMKPDDLTSALAAGKTVPQLAKQQKVDMATVRSAYLAAAKTFLAQDVSNDTITQAQADALNKMLASAVVKDSYPLIDIGKLASLGQ